VQVEQPGERFGLDAILKRNATLSARLHEALSANRPDFRPLPEAHRSQIVSAPVASAESTLARLRAAGVVASARAGRVRLSVHLYNLEEDIDRAVALL
jgi:selenocysteine lyase/cysteine desulfurase